MDFHALRVDSYPVDAELRDAGVVGPELAHLAGRYVDSPRALIWRNPSSEWRLFVVLLPLASRLSLMANPIFAQLVRAWGLNVRFIGVDAARHVYDFRALLSDRTLKLLLDILGSTLDAPAPRHQAANDQALDVLFAALAEDMLTVLDRRRADWDKHLDIEHCLEATAACSLFDRASRYPDFLAALRQALRDEIIDVAFYGRALRSVDLREDAVDARVAGMIEACLEPTTLAKLERAGIGRHLGCYNWLQMDRRHAAARAHVLGRLPGFASYFAEALVPLDAAFVPLLPDPEADDADERRHGAEHRPDAPPFDLRILAARPDSLHHLHWNGVLRRAIDAGQDRAVIEALAQRFAVGDNVIRRLWRESPAAFGRPPTWHLAQILRQLADLGERDWPANDLAWRTLIERSVPEMVR